jgi:hypothetical protein
MGKWQVAPRRAPCERAAAALTAAPFVRSSRTGHITAALSQQQGALQGQQAHGGHAHTPPSPRPAGFVVLFHRLKGRGVGSRGKGAVGGWGGD